MQGTEIAKKLAEDDKKGTLPKELYNHYTIVTLDENGKYTQVAYVEYFTTEIGAIVAEFDAWIKELEAVDGDEAIKATYSDYLAHYRCGFRAVSCAKLLGMGAAGRQVCCDEGTRSPAVMLGCAGAAWQRRTSTSWRTSGEFWTKSGWASSTGSK